MANVIKIKRGASSHIQDLVLQEGELALTSDNGKLYGGLSDGTIKQLSGVDDYNELKNKPTIPTKTSQLTNDSNFITSSYHDSSKQDKLVSGTNIKTVNGNSLLGSGNIVIEPGGAADDVTTRLNSDNETEVIGIYTTQNSARKIWEGTKAQYDALTTKDPNTYYYITDEGTGAEEDNESIVKNADEKLSAVGVIDAKTGNANKQWTGTLAEYNAIATKDPDTYYTITDDTVTLNARVYSGYSAPSSSLGENGDIYIWIDEEEE